MFFQVFGDKLQRSEKALIMYCGAEAAFLVKIGRFYIFEYKTRSHSRRSIS